MKDLKLTSLYKYKRDNGSEFVGSIVEGTLDGGDYGVSYTIDLLQPNDEILFSVPVSKLEEIDREEYIDTAMLNYGIEVE